MAPKRAAGKGGESSAKRQKLFHQHVHTVKSALKNKEYDLGHIPAVVRDMLHASVDHALKGESDERHEFQNTNTAMIQEVFKGIRAKLEAARDETKRFVETASEKEGELEAAIEETKQALEAKKNEIKERSGAKAEAAGGVKEADKGVDKAKHLEKEQEHKKTALTKEHTKLCGVYDEAFSVLRDGPPEKKEAHALVKRVSPMLHLLQAGDAMTRGLPAAILKTVEQRGEFDKMTITAVDDLFRKAKADSEGKLQAQARDQEAAHAASAAAQQAADAATAKHEACEAALHQAENERHEGEANLKYQETGLKDHRKRFKQASGELKGCEAKITEFVKAEEAFAFAKDFSSKQPEEPEPAAEDVAAPEGAAQE